MISVMFAFVVPMAFSDTFNHLQRSRSKLKFGRFNIKFYRRNLKAVGRNHSSWIWKNEYASCSKGTEKKQTKQTFQSLLSN